LIGNEILSGRTQDANLSFLGQRCDQLGILLQEARVIQDDEQTIIKTVNEARVKYNYVFTTGGIGPTHDDITSASIARAFGVDVERHPDAVAAMSRYYPSGKLTDARLKMADVPKGAALIDNPVSGAPGIQMENVFVLPGVPTIMQAMFDGITDRLVGGKPMLTVSVRTNLTEGILAEDLAGIQDRYPEVSIGSYPYFSKGKLGVNLVVRTTDEKELQNTVDDIKKLIIDLDGEVLNNQD
ncbi:MAG: molybdopterin-binding protein, partial [Gammaproteobacteria bacterium]